MLKDRETLRHEIIRWCKAYNYLSKDRKFDINRVKFFTLIKSSRDLQNILKFLQDNVLELLESKLNKL